MSEQMAAPTLDVERLRARVRELESRLQVHAERELEELASPAAVAHPSAQDLGLRGGVDDSCVHGRSVWSCPLCDARQLSELVSLWGQDAAAAASCRRSVRMVWPELGERLDDLLDQHDSGARS